MAFIIDTEAQQQLQPNLLDREKLLWIGKPKTGILFKTSDVFFIPFSIFWFGAVLNTGFSGGISIDIFLIPFIIAGLFATVGRFFWDSKLRRKTIYGITETKIMIKSGVFFRELKSYDIRSFSNIELSEKDNGFGTVDFNNGGFLSKMGLKPNWEPPPPRFELIENAREVYDLLIKLKYT